MSEMKSREPVYAPALFPKQGRLPSDPQVVRRNYERQIAEINDYRQKQNADRGLRDSSTCARALYVRGKG